MITSKIDPKGLLQTFTLPHTLYLNRQVRRYLCENLCC